MDPSVQILLYASSAAEYLQVVSGKTTPTQHSPCFQPPAPPVTHTQAEQVNPGETLNPSAISAIKAHFGYEG